MKNKTNDTYGLRKIKKMKCERELQVHPFRVYLKPALMGYCKTIGFAAVDIY